MVFVTRICPKQTSDLQVGLPLRRLGARELLGMPITPLPSPPDLLSQTLRRAPKSLAFSKGYTLGSPGLGRTTARLPKGPGGWVVSQQRPSRPTRHFEPAPVPAPGCAQGQRRSPAETQAQMAGWGHTPAASVGGLGNTRGELTASASEFLVDGSLLNSKVWILHLDGRPINIPQPMVSAATPHSCITP